VLGGAAATAWLAPLPPGEKAAAPPSTVAPGAGRRGTVTEMSMFRLPSTVSRGAETTRETYSLSRPAAAPLRLTWREYLAAHRRRLEQDRVTLPVTHAGTVIVPVLLCSQVFSHFTATFRQ